MAGNKDDIFEGYNPVLLFLKGLFKAVKRMFGFVNFNNSDIPKSNIKKTVIKEEPEKPKPTSKDWKQSEKKHLDSRLEQLTYILADLKSKTPESPEFWGEKIEYPRKKRRLSFIKRSLPDLNELRSQFDDLSKGAKMTELRKQVRKYLKYHPYNPELRALRGMRIYSDLSQSGIDHKKLDSLKIALTEIGRAIHNGGLSIFYVNWFMKVYIKYLEDLQRKVILEYSNVGSSYHWQIQRISDELQKLLIHVTSLLAIKSQITGLNTLNSKLKGTAYIYDCLSSEEISNACLIQTGDDTKKIGVGKTANYIIWEVITLASLFARIPSFRNFVNEILAQIPDVSKTLILQKCMVGTLIAVSEYQFAIAHGDSMKTMEAAFRLFNRCENIIEQHLQNALPTRLYEVDPYLKAAWITKESKGLFESMEYKKMLEKSMEYISLVLENYDAVKGSYEQATQLQHELQEIMLDYNLTPI